LQYLHDRQIIHRDVKPENLLLGRDGGVLLGDFGIAIYADYADQADVVGTIPYMAPEQFEGKPQFASDQYALGVVVYEWLSGGLPFNGNREAIVMQHLYAPPPPLREQVPAISPAVEQVVLRALAKNPEDRFPNVRAFAEALEEALFLERATTINVDARRSFINLRIMEEPLTSLNVVRTLSALTELYTKCWLIYQGRFIDLIDYAQTHSVHFDREANLTITKLRHNSPLDIKLDISVEGIAKAFETALNAVIGIGSRKKEAELKNKALDEEIEQKKREAELKNKALDEEIEQKKREAETDFADKEQGRQREARRAWIEDQQALVDLEERRLKFRREQVAFEMGLVDYALDTSKKMVEILYPISSTETKAIAAQTLINNILQLGEGRKLELVQRVSHKENEMSEQSLLTSNDNEKEDVENIDTQTE